MATSVPKSATFRDVADDCLLVVVYLLVNSKGETSTPQEKDIVVTPGVATALDIAKLAASIAPELCRNDPDEAVRCAVKLLERVQSELSGEREEAKIHCLVIVKNKEILAESVELDLVNPRPFLKRLGSKRFKVESKAGSRYVRDSLEKFFEADFRESGEPWTTIEVVTEGETSAGIIFQWARWAKVNGRQKLEKLRIPKSRFEKFQREH